MHTTGRIHCSTRCSDLLEICGGNFELLRGLGEVTSRIRWPSVVGPSRKGLVGKVTGMEVAKERTWGTVGAVAVCVAGGADVVRAHDVVGIQKVVDTGGGYLVVIIFH